SSTPVTIRYVNDSGTPTTDEFNSQVTKRITEKYNGKINVQVEPFPDPDWGVRYQKYTAMSLANALPEVIWSCCQYIRPFSIDGADRNCTWIYNNGGEPHDPKDGPLVTKLTYDDPKSVDGLQFLHDQLWKNQVSPKSNDDRNGLSRDDAFLGGKIAMVMDAA